MIFQVFKSVESGTFAKTTSKQKTKNKTDIPYLEEIIERLGILT